MANEHHEDGIYFGLPEDEYHADPALGSSSLKKLATNPALYWWESPMNPDRPKENDRAAMIEGTATHLIVLEGQDKFRERYLCGEDQEGMSTADKTQSTKKHNQKAAAAGMVGLKFEVFKRIEKAHESIQRNESLKMAFQNGASEVSVFWTRPGNVRLKARFDYLKIKAIGDLKTIANERNLPMDRACANAIATYDYLVQAASYLEGRSLFSEFVALGRVYGVPDKAWLTRVAAATDFGFQWVFLTKSGPPLTHSRTVSLQNILLDKARAKVDVACANYLSFMQHYGTDKPWITQTEPRELTVEELPRWYDFEEVGQ